MYFFKNQKTHYNEKWERRKKSCSRCLGNQLGDVFRSSKSSFQWVFLVFKTKKKITDLAVKWCKNPKKESFLQFLLWFFFSQKQFRYFFKVFQYYFHLLPNTSQIFLLCTNLPPYHRKLSQMQNFTGYRYDLDKC